MRHLPWVTEDLLARLEALHSELGRCPGRRSLIVNLGLTNSKAKRLARWWKDKKGEDPSFRGWAGDDAPPVAPVVADTGDSCAWSEDGEKASGSGRVRAESKVQSLDALKEALEVDEEIWYVKRWVGNRWEMPSDGSKLPLWQVKAWFERRFPQVVENTAEALIERMAEHAPKYPKLRRKRITDPHMLEVSLVDHHFGKLAWRREAGEDYDLEIAEQVWKRAVEDIIAKTDGFPIEKVLLPIGHDFFNFDDPRGQTASGTPQDNDSRPVKVFRVGCMAAVYAIDLLLEVADVEVVFVPGNHDPSMSFYLIEYLRAWYRRCSHVEFQDDPLSRKYVRYGRSLIGLTHGDMSKAAKSQLPTIMASECKAGWAATDFHEWHTGHLHRKGEIQVMPLESFSGVIIRELPSLCRADKWHYEQGYVGNLKATDAYLWSKEHGLTGYVTSYDETGAA